MIHTLRGSIMMDKKKIIIIALIIIVLASCMILITSQNNTNDTDNYNQSTNNTTKNNISNKTLENNSKNNQATELCVNSIYFGSSINAKNHLSNDKNRNGLVEVTDDDIKKLVEEYVGWQNPITGEVENEVVIGEPYKSKGGSWLVPAFNKNTGKFIGSVWVGAVNYKDDDGSFSHGFSNGPNSYSVYKDIISGKDVDYGGDFTHDVPSENDSVLRSGVPEASTDNSNPSLEDIGETSDLNNTTV